MVRILAVVFALVCVAPAVAQVKLPAGLDPQNTVLLDTKYGRVIIKLRNDLAPHHAERIKQLARDGFYNNCPFHRVIAGFMAQTGDGQYGNGTGGSKYPDLKAEFSDVPFTRGVVGMARTSDPNSATAQFFINFIDNTFLNYKSSTPQGWGYAVFGEVVQGMEVVDGFGRIPTGPGGPFPSDVPKTPIVINKATVISE